MSATLPLLETLLARMKRLRDGAPASQSECVVLAQGLMDHKRWLDAASLWELARSDRTLEREPRVSTLSIAQQALCISKERGDLKLDDAFKQSLDLLKTADLANTTDQETLGIAGGVYKGYWDAFRQGADLEQAFVYYDRGWKAGGIADDGYTGINAAYVADVRAFVEETIACNAGGPRTSASAEALRAAACSYRQTIVDKAPELLGRANTRTATPTTRPADHAWWISVTLAEAHFGLTPYDPAHYRPTAEYLRRAMALPNTPEWMVETTARQLGAIARMQEAASGETGTDSRPWQVLDVLVERAPGLRTEVGGKVGLALSGGGFRASLFHIGVLARLAELDMLRHVEVISCVSGGSILGAAYYLRLRELLNGKRDRDIKREDYIHIIRHLETNFLSGVQNNNFRMRMLETFSANLGMLKNRSSRTESLGRVMGRELYGSDSTLMSDIVTTPPDGEPGFRTVDLNWSRMNKVPLLVLNATSQAGGHPWHFTPYEMGEPQLSAVDSNPQLRRAPYTVGEMPHLWRAVSASACVPVLFEPIRVKFHGQKVDLLDGGVHDNQGSSALLDRDCTLMLVSDASGQLSNDANASTSIAAVGLRADGIVQERLRIALYEALEARRRGSLLRGVLFLHLRLGLDADEAKPTSYGISTAVQRRLSNIRTDLDVFHDAEALSLMVSGYRMAKEQFSEQLPQIASMPAADYPWDFLALDQSVTALPPVPRLLKLLDVSGERLFKAWRAIPLLKWIGRLLLAAVTVGALVALYRLWQSPSVIRVSALASTIAFTLAGLLAERLLSMKIPSWKKEVTFVIMALTGAALAWLHKTWIDPAYLRAGQRERFRN